MNRKALGPQRILEPIKIKTKKTQLVKQKKKEEAKPQQAATHETKGSPEKIPNRDSTLIQFDCDTSISLPSEDYEFQHKTPSPQRPAAKKRFETHAREYHSTRKRTLSKNEN